MLRRVVALVGCLSFGAASPAFAQTSETDRNLAESLFAQARNLMTSGKYAEACPKLAESQRLDPGGGTLLNLAVCYEKEGKVASAWSAFKEALGVARRDRREDRVEAALARIAALEPTVPWLTVTVSQPVEGEVVVIDGASFGSAGWGVPVAIDPGEHRLEVSAPGHHTWKHVITMGLGEKKTVSVPALEAAAAVAPAPIAANEATPSGSARSVSAKARAEDVVSSDPVSRAPAWVLGGVGVAALATGTFFGVQAISKRKASDGECPTDETCTDHGVRLNNQAKTAAWVSNAGIGVGVAALAVSTYLFLRPGPPRRAGTVPRRLSLDANLGRHAGALSLRGSF